MEAPLSQPGLTIAEMTTYVTKFLAPELLKIYIESAQGRFTA